MESILSKVRSLSDEEYQNFMIQAFDQNRPGNIQRAVLKAISKKGHRSNEKRGKEGIGVDTQGTELSWPSLQCENTKSAWRVPFIFRGDLVPENSFVFLDVEKVSLKTEGRKHEQIAAVLSIVNINKELIMWLFIKPEKAICQYFCNLTGLTATKLNFGLPIETVQRFCKDIFKSNTVVGLDIDADIYSLGLDALSTSTEDLGSYFYERKTNKDGVTVIAKYSLKDLVQHLFHADIQCSVHSAIIDSQYSRDVWVKKNELIKSQPIFKDPIIRTK